MEDVVEQLGQAQALGHPLGVDAVGVGEDQSPSGQAHQGGLERRVVGQDLQGQVLEDGVELLRADAVVLDQAGERQAVLGEIALLQDVGFVAGQAGDAHDVVTDAPVDLLRHAGVEGIEGVVEVEEPGVDVGKVGGFGG